MLRGSIFLLLCLYCLNLPTPNMNYAQEYGFCRQESSSLSLSLLLLKCHSSFSIHLAPFAVALFICLRVVQPIPKHCTTYLQLLEAVQAAMMTLKFRCKTLSFSLALCLVIHTRQETNKTNCWNYPSLKNKLFRCISGDRNV